VCTPVSRLLGGFDAIKTRKAQRSSSLSMTSRASIRFFLASCKRAGATGLRWMGYRCVSVRLDTRLIDVWNEHMQKGQSERSA